MMSDAPQPASVARPAFASVVQGILIILMGLSFVMIAQQFNRSIYQVGLLLMIASTVAQIAFGNIPSTAGVRRSLTMLVVILVVIVIVVVVGISLVPTLLQLGRR
jgi:hypothetical protein